MLYLRKTVRGCPKAISRRTSYLRVRLEFLPYPHLIPTLFNGCGFGPPLPFTATSTWTWIDHPVSGLLTDSRPIKTWFPFGSAPKVLNLAGRATRRTVLQKVRGSSYKVSQLVKHLVFRFFFTPLPGFFSPFLTVLCAIGH